MDGTERSTHAKFDEDDFDIVLLHASESDPSAFRLLYHRHAATILRYAWSIARTEAEALDLLQETFATLWDKRETARVVDESILPWLLTVCRNHGLHLARSRRRHATVALETVADRPADDGRTRDWMTDALSQLTDTDRKLCELCLIEGFTYREAARLLTLTEAAVGKRLERARIKLRKVATDHD